MVERSNPLTAPVDGNQTHTKIKQGDNAKPEIESVVKTEQKTVETAKLVGGLPMIPARNTHEMDRCIYYDQYLQGNRDALIVLIAHCVATGLAVPEDAAVDFADGIGRWQELEVRTLNEALKIDERKGWRLADRRKKKALAQHIYWSVETLHELGNVIDSEIFAKPVDPSIYEAGAVRNIYYEVKAEIERNDEKVFLRKLDSWAGSDPDNPFRIRSRCGRGFKDPL